MPLFHGDPDFRLLVGDASEELASLPDGSVDCVVTSPPYWGLRDYGVDKQLGLEATPEEFVDRLVEVFRGVRRVLAGHGTVWLNLGDSYANGTLVGIPWRVAFALQADGWGLRSDVIWSKPNAMPESVTDRPTKAHEFLFMLTKGERYYYDREAVREPYLGGDEPGGARGPDGRRVTVAVGKDGSIQHRNGERWPNPDGRNVRTVWEIDRQQYAREVADALLVAWEVGMIGEGDLWRIVTQPYPGAHFATFPEKLAERALAASCPEWVCRTCGKPQRGDCGHQAYRPGVVLDPFLGSGTVALVARRSGRHAVGVELSAEYAALAVERCRRWWARPEAVRAPDPDQLSLMA